MDKLLGKIGNLIGFAITSVIAIGIAMLFSPILVPLFIHGSVTSYFFNRKYKEYLQSSNGTKFFCYNNKTNAYSYIKSNIIPMLPEDVKVIYLNGRTPITEYEVKYISHALHSIKDRKGFPYLLKITDGKLVDQSINHVFYNTMNQNKDLRVLEEKISLFFRSNDK